MKALRLWTRSRTYRLFFWLGAAVQLAATPWAQCAVAEDTAIAVVDNVTLTAGTNTLQQNIAAQQMQLPSGAMRALSPFASTNVIPVSAGPVVIQAGQTEGGVPLSPNQAGGGMAPLLIGSHILNIDFAGSNKTGPAAIGQGPSDSWNACVRGPATWLNLLWSDRSASGVNVTVQGGAGAWGNSMCVDPMYASFMYGGDLTVTLTGLPADTYDFFVYATRPDNFAPVIEFKRDSITLWTKALTSWGDGWYSTYWDEHEQYVRFRSIAVNGNSIILHVRTDTSGFQAISGIQVVPSSVLPSDQLAITRLLNIDFGGCSAPYKSGLAATGLGVADIWNNDCHTSQHAYTLGGLRWSDGSACPATVRIVNAPGCYGNTLPDAMMSEYIYSFDAGNATITINGLPEGTCDLYLYGHTPNPDDNAVFELWSDDVDWGIKGTSVVGPGPTYASWELGQQYVRFKDIAVRAGKPVIIQAKHTTYGYNNVSGLQLAYTGPLDSDGDGLPDGWENRWFGNLQPTADGDPDGDGLTNLREYVLGTDPTRSDSNANGLGDLYDFEKVWFDDATPQGGYASALGGDDWNWIDYWCDGDGWAGQELVAHSGAPLSYRLMVVSAKTPDALHQHSFERALGVIRPVSGDVLFAWVNIDPTYPPAEVMLQWQVRGDDGATSWEHRAYWGADLIASGQAGTQSRYPMGALPSAGQWVRLEVPASAVGLEGEIIEGMTFSLYGGRAAWDSSGTINPDRDGNGLPDSWEMQYFGQLRNDPNSDSDGDGLSNAQEYALSLDPTSADTGATGTSDGYKDADGDGLLNIEEFNLGTDPLQPNVAALTFSPVGGSYPSTRTVAITCPTAGATIRYTLDGTEPTEASPVYSGAVLVDHSLSLKAKAWKTGWTSSDTESEGYLIEDPPSNQAPTVTILPPDGTSFVASESIEIFVEASDADGTIAKVQLFRGAFKVAEATSGALRYSLPSVPAGNYAYTARAIDNAGAVSPRGTVTFGVSAPGPVVSLVGTQPMFTTASATLLASITGVNPGALSSVTLNGTALALRTGEFTVPVSLSEGENTFTLVATDNQQRSAEATATVYLDSVPPFITITAPANNSTFSTTRTDVSGTFTETSLKSITVNGIPAFISGNSWLARNVPLVAGANTITATAQDIAGNSATASIMINGADNPVDPVQLAAAPVGGFFPLVVTFTPQSSAPGTLQQVLYDFDGDGVTDYTTASLAPITHTYATAGQFFPVVTIVTSVGRFSSVGGWNCADPNGIRINVQIPPVQGTTISIADPVDLKWVPGNFLYVLSRSSATITEYDVSGTSPSVVRSLSGIGTTPTGLDVDAAGKVYVALSGDNQVARFSPTTTSFQLDTTFGVAGVIGKDDRSAGTGSGEFSGPYDVAISPDGTVLAISDSGNNRIQQFGSDGTFIAFFGQQGSGLGQFNTPKGLVYDGIGKLYIVDSGNNRVVLAYGADFLGTSGSYGSALGQFEGPVNLALGTSGIYVGDSGNNRIGVFDPLASGQTPPFSARLALANQFSPPLSQPNAVCLFPDLLQEKLYIADTGNNRVLLVVLPADTPEAVWSAMKQRLLAGDITGAMPYFAASAAEDYRQLYLALGTSELASMISQIPAISPIFIEGDEAQYYFQQAIDEVTITFPIDFVKESGTWKILEY